MYDAPSGPPGGRRGRVGGGVADAPGLRECGAGGEARPHRGAGRGVGTDASRGGGSRRRPALGSVPVHPPEALRAGAPPGVAAADRAPSPAGAERVPGMGASCSRTGTGRTRRLCGAGRGAGGRGGAAGRSVRDRCMARFSTWRTNLLAHASWSPRSGRWGQAGVPIPGVRRKSAPRSMRWRAVTTRGGARPS